MPIAGETALDIEARGGHLEERPPANFRSPIDSRGRSPDYHCKWIVCHGSRRKRMITILPELSYRVFRKSTAVELRARCRLCAIHVRAAQTFLHTQEDTDMAMAPAGAARVAQPHVPVAQLPPCTGTSELRQVGCAVMPAQAPRTR